MKIDLFHGTNGPQFDAFDWAEDCGNNVFGRGIYLASTTDEAREYGRNIARVVVESENAFNVTSARHCHELLGWLVLTAEVIDGRDNYDELMEAAHRAGLIPFENDRDGFNALVWEAGYDAVFSNLSDGTQWWMVPSPRQISAIEWL